MQSLNALASTDISLAARHPKGDIPLALKHQGDMSLLQSLGDGARNDISLDERHPMVTFPLALDRCRNVVSHAAPR